MENPKSLLKNIQALFLDVDGTLTDGKLYYGDRRDESKSFCVQDGLGIVAWQKLGKFVAVISGRQSDTVMRRCEEIGIREVHLGIQDKTEVAKELIKKFNLEFLNCACIGDDLNDLGLFGLCGVSFSPVNANPYIQKEASIQLCRAGGEGCVREAIDMIIDSQNLRGKVIEYFKK